MHTSTIIIGQSDDSDHSSAEISAQFDTSRREMISEYVRGDA